MRHRWLINLSLLGIALILSIFVIFTPNNKEKNETPKLTKIDSEKVQYIRIERMDKEDKVLEFQRDEHNTWQIKSPLDLSANRFRVDSILRILSSQQYKKLTELPALSEVKLELPEVRVQFDDLIMDFGDVSPIDNTQRYIKIGESVYLIMDTVYHFLTENVPSFVNLSILGENPKITELRLPDYHLQQKEGTWTLLSTAPENIDTSSDALNGLIDNWKHTQALSVKEYKENEANNEGQIEIKFQENSLQLTIVSTSPNLILARSDKNLQYQLPITHIEKLLQLPQKESENLENVDENSEAIEALPVDNSDEENQDSE